MSYQIHYASPIPRTMLKKKRHPLRLFLCLGLFCLLAIPKIRSGLLSFFLSGWEAGSTFRRQLLRELRSGASFPAAFSRFCRQVFSLIPSKGF